MFHNQFMIQYGELVKALYLCHPGLLVIQLLVLALEVGAEAPLVREQGEELVKAQTEFLLPSAQAGKVGLGAGCHPLDPTPGTRPSCTIRTLHIMTWIPEEGLEAFLWVLKGVRLMIG